MAISTYQFEERDFIPAIMDDVFAGKKGFQPWEGYKIRKAIGELHVMTPNENGEQYCAECILPYPCNTTKLLDGDYSCIRK